MKVYKGSSDTVGGRNSQYDDNNPDKYEGATPYSYPGIISEHFEFTEVSCESTASEVTYAGSTYSNLDKIEAQVKGWDEWTGTAIKCEVTLITKIKSTDFIEYAGFTSGYPWGAILIDMQAPDISYRLVHEFLIGDCPNSIYIDLRHYIPDFSSETKGDGIVGIDENGYGKIKFFLNFQMSDDSEPITLAERWWKTQPEEFAQSCLRGAYLAETCTWTADGAAITAESPSGESPYFVTE